MTTHINRCYVQLSKYMYRLFLKRKCISYKLLEKHTHFNYVKRILLFLEEYSCNVNFNLILNILYRLVLDLSGRI